MLEASHTLEGRLQQLRSSAPDSETLVKEISGLWRKHLERLDRTGVDRTGVDTHLKAGFYCSNAAGRTPPPPPPPLQQQRFCLEGK